jgi:hypothetical protein
VQISAPARRRLFRPAVSRPALAAPTQLSGLVEKLQSLQGPAERACRRRADHDSAPRKEPDGPSSVVANLPLTGAANCSFAEPAPARVNEALATQLTRPDPGSQPAGAHEPHARILRERLALANASPRPPRTPEGLERSRKAGWKHADTQAIWGLSLGQHAD